MTPRLSSLNVGAPAHFTTAEPWSSGIYKSPVVGRIPLSFVNLAGDGQADLTVHGGPDKAVCVYSMDHYPFWRRELEIDECGPGWFGENFSIEGQTETQVAIGDTFEIGTAVVQISQPRAPCWKLGRRWNRLDMPKLVVHSGRTGWYLRVIETGHVESGDVLTLVERPLPASDRRRSQRRGVQPRRRDEYGRRAGARELPRPCRGLARRIQGSCRIGIRGGGVSDRRRSDPHRHQQLDVDQRHEQSAGVERRAAQGALARRRGQPRDR